MAKRTNNFKAGTATPDPVNPVLVAFFRKARELAELARQREAEAERQALAGAEGADGEADGSRTAGADASGQTEGGL